MMLISKTKLTTTLAVIFVLPLFWFRSVVSARLPKMAESARLPQSRSKTQMIADDAQALPPTIIDGIKSEVSTGSLGMESDVSNGKESLLVFAAELRGVGSADLQGTHVIHGPSAYSNFGEENPSTERRVQREDGHLSYTKGIQSTTIHAFGDKLKALQFPTSDNILSNQMFDGNSQNLHSYLPPFETVNSSNLNTDSTSSASLPSDIEQLPPPHRINATLLVNPPPRCSGFCEVTDTAGDCRKDINCILLG